jgi:hypothetical protein
VQTQEYNTDEASIHLSSCHYGGKGESPKRSNGVGNEELTCCCNLEQRDVIVTAKGINDVHNSKSYMV